MSDAFKCDKCEEFRDGTPIKYHLNHNMSTLYRLELCDRCSSRLEDDVRKYSNE